MIRTGAFSPHAPDLFAPIVRSLLDEGDRYLVLADYQDYVACQDVVARTYRDQAAWTRKSTLNTAHMGEFSSTPPSASTPTRSGASRRWAVRPRKAVTLDHRYGWGRLV